MRLSTDLIWLRRRRTAASNGHAGVPTPPASSFFAVGLLAIAAMAPAGLSPVPLPSLPGTPAPAPSAPSAPGLASPVTVGAVLKAVDKAGHPLATARFDVYRADQPDGEQQPILDISAVSGGTTTVPLPEPSAIPDAASNYFVVSTGMAADGSSATGIDFFNLTPQFPLANATITPNLFQVPPVTIFNELPPGVTDPPSVPPSLPPAPNPSDTPIPSVTNYDHLPIDDVPDPGPTPSTPPVTGPCGFQPDTEHPPPPAFDITTETMGVIDGTVQVGAAHGAGDWGGNDLRPDDLIGSDARAIGEKLSSEWSRSTDSSVMMAVDTHGETQTPYVHTGNLHFTLASSDVKLWATAKGHSSQAGFGERALVVPATWLHQKISFHCRNDGTTETHEIWHPHEWRPTTSPDTPSITPDFVDNYDAFRQQPVSTRIAMKANQDLTFSAGVSQGYSNGYGTGGGTGPAELQFEVASQTDYAATHEVEIWSGGNCGTVAQTTCYAYVVDDSQVQDAECPWELACGSDYYAAVMPVASTTPNPPVEPCSKYEPHGACD